jgi:hypothetical protein
MDKVDAYSDFLEWLTNTEAANYSSKRDLENYESQIQFAKDEKAEVIAEMYAVLGPLFKTLTEEQQEAMGYLCHLYYYRGIVNCLEQIRYNDSISLVHKKSDTDIEILDARDYPEDFKKVHKKLEGF